MREDLTRTFSYSKKVFLSVLLSSSMLISSVAFAEEVQEKVQEEETIETFTLDPIVVTAQRRATKDLDTPASVVVLTQAQLKETGASNLFDALKLQNGVVSYSYGSGGESWGAMNSKIILRGNEKGTLVMIDGVPIGMNDNYFLETLPIEAIERIEIVKGASSVLYGNNASGGVINIITKTNMKNSIALTLGEYGRYKQNLTLNLGRFSITGSFEQSDLKKGLSTNGAVFNDRDRSSILWKYKIADDLTLTHQHTSTNYKNARWRSVNNVVNWNQPFEGGRYKYKEDFIRLQYTPDTWKINLFYNRSDRDKLTTNATTNALKTSENVLLDEWGLDAQTEWKSGFASFIGGVNYSHESYQLRDRLAASKNYDADRNTYALFLQATKDFGKDLTAIVGFRQEWFKSTNRKTLDAFCPQFQLLAKVDDNNSIYLNIAKTFKMPNFTALYGSASSVMLANPALQPEEGWSYEIGWKKASKNSMLKTALYHLNMEAITYISVAGHTQPINNPFSNVGLEITYDRVLSKKYSFSVGANFSNPKTKSNTTGLWGRKYARQNYTASLKYMDDKWTMALSGSITADRAGGVKDMVPVNFHASYKLNKNSSLALNIENIFNRKDMVGNWTSPTSTRYYSMPRNVSLTYSISF